MPARKLFDAAQQFCAQAGFPFPLASLTLGFANGSTCRVDCPHFSPPTEVGWVFTPVGAIHAGRALRVCGKQLAVLKLLADAAEPMTLVAIREALWDRHTAESTVVNCISKLRIALREQLSLPPDRDPIDATEDGYFLTVG